MGALMKSLPLDEHIAVHIAELFRSFSDTSRVRILHAIIDQEMNTSKIAELIGITESAVSHHLRGLRQQHLVHSHRVGKEVFYQVIDEHIISLFQQGVKHIQEK
jgi:ArsR family transcriptional regulator, lead/cadmium/zinc/bismuth-responsive transcriptional repressor